MSKQAHLGCRDRHSCKVSDVTSIFAKIISGEIPSRRLWDDEVCVSFLDVRPLAPGHALVVPRAEIDAWTDLPIETAAHLMTVAHHIGNAQRAVFSPARIGLIIAGFEVPHAHLHVIPANSMQAFDFGRADTDPDTDVLDQQLHDLRSALVSSGHEAAVSGR